MSSSFLLSSSVFVVFAIAAAAAASGGSGATPPENQSPTTPTAVTIIPHEKVTDAFKKGVPMLETGEYKINAGRRDAPGGAEVHTRDTDVFYILEGSGVLVTGGTVQEQKTVAPNEIRGSGLTGGESHTMNKGDVIVIPRGTPHWIKEVPQAPLLYFVVKTVAPEGTK
jgi:mannose-6-phosphate isomerase-like protein (cupin superfamily)